MGIDVIQSQDLDVLLDAVTHISSQPVDSVSMLFQPQYFVVPNYGIGQWVQQNIAKRLGVSANIKFLPLRTMQWQLYQTVLGKKKVADAPHMLNMKWQIFLKLGEWFGQPFAQDHALFSLFQRVEQHSGFIQNKVERQNKQQNMLYWIADQTSRLFANYMIYRGQCMRACRQPCKCRQNWLAYWERNEALPIEHWIRQPEAEIQQAQPEALSYAITQAQSLEAWQRFIWHQLFAEDFVQIQQIDQEFWQLLEQQPQMRQLLPQQIYIFTLLELPPSQLYFLRHLAQYISIKVFHYTPSQEYWADSVDPKWRAKFALKHPHKAEYYESRHPLLTRLGKQARDMSALLSQLSGGEEGEWQDIFSDTPPQNLLQKIQSDILHLREPELASYSLSEQDKSLQVHVCYSTLRQLEVLKDQLIHWLNAETKQPRQLSDILVLVPNLQDVESQIRTVFAQNYESAQTHIPIKIAGVPALDAVQLWQAITARMRLLQQRFSLQELIDWLSLLPIQKIYALQFEDIQRIGELLHIAGFRRGFDPLHLKNSLSAEDKDYRFSFRYALDRLTLAVAMPEHAIFADVLSLEQVNSSDFELIAKLLMVYQDLDKRRTWLDVKPIDEQWSIEHSFTVLDEEVQQFKQVVGIESVQTALEQLQRIIRVTVTQRDSFHQLSSQLSLPLHYILNEVENTLIHQIGQTEPTGAVTFAQMGQLRPLPYRLIVCLNMDTGTFPNRDSHIPFDLMNLLTTELGDRSRLEDDQGAFLDALLQAKDNFWLFYNGFDINDHEVRDPSSIVQELVNHLALIVAPPQHQQLDSTLLDGVEVAHQLRPLFYVHPLQPFDPLGFSLQDRQRFANQWFEIAQQIVKPQPNTLHWINQPYLASEDSSFILDARQWIKDLCFPAQHFLRQVGIQGIQTLEQLERFEPLQLNALQQYQIRADLQQSLTQNQQLALDQTQEIALFQDHLPIGKAQYTTWQMALSEHQWIAQRLQQYGGEVTATTQQLWQYSEDWQFYLHVPNAPEQTRWLSLNASKCRDERPLQVWLEYLLWRASRDVQDNLQRIALYHNVTLIIEGLTQQQAQQYLRWWMDVWQLARQQPFVLPPASFANVLKDKPKWQFDNQNIAYIENYAKLEERWLGSKFYNNKNFSAYQDKGSVLQQDWALLLKGMDAKTLLNQFCQRYAAELYQPLTEHIQVVEEV